MIASTSHNEESGQGRAIIYIRRSTTQQGQSLEGQLAWAIEEAVKRHLTCTADQIGLKEAIEKRLHRCGDVYIDDGITGSDMNRPGFMQFHARAVSDPQITHAMFWARDRFARPEHAEMALGKEKSILLAGKHVVVAVGMCLGPRERGSDSTAEDLMLLLEYSAAGRFRPDLAAKVLRALSARADKGYSCGGRPPYGFKRVHVMPGLSPRELAPGEWPRPSPGAFVTWLPGTTPLAQEQLAIVRRIFDRYLNRDEGCHRIAKALNAEGVPSPGAGQLRRGIAVSGKWNAVVIRHILEHPTYSGLIPWARTAEGSTLRFEASAKGSRPTKASEIRKGTAYGKKITERDREKWVLRPAPIPFEPIISRELWEAAYEKVLEVSTPLGQRGKPKCQDANKYPLRVICGDCGRVMSGSEFNDNIPRYVCSTYKMSQGKDCHHNRVPREAMVQYALGRIAAALDGPAMARLKSAVKSRLESKADDDELATERLDQTRRLADLERQRGMAYEDKLRALDEDTRRDAAVAYDRLMAQCREARRKLGALPDGTVQATERDEVEETVGLLRQLHRFLRRVPDSMLRETFTRLGVEATVRFEQVQKRKRSGRAPCDVELRIGASGGPLLAAAADLTRAREGGSPGSLLKDGRGDRI